MLTDKECRAATLGGGKEKRLTFGLYPAVSLKSARIERGKDRSDPAVGDGSGSRSARAERAWATRSAPTFQEVAPC